MKASVKVKITALVTVLMLMLSVLMLLVMMSVSRAVAYRSAMDQLTRAAQARAPMISMENGRLALEGGFEFYEHGVYILVYGASGALIAGQPPVALGDEGFDSGSIRTLPAGEHEYLVLDMWLPMGWEDGLWLRALMERPDTRQTARDLLLAGLIALPLFILLGAIGAYRIVRRSFMPLDHISSTAAAIDEAKDLSARIALEGKDEFSRLAATFDSLFERLERSFEAEKQFTADASHELRTPVSIIKGACEYGARYDETEEERKETLAMIYRQAEKMSGLISQLLSMTRLEQGTEQITMERVELHALVREVCREQGYDRLSLDLEEAAVEGSPMLLSRLVQNLAENAFKYGGPEGRVWISLYREGGEIRLSVRDEGIGIPQEEQDKVWQRFYQVDGSRSGEQGAGLGLAMVRQIARVHGGYMSLKSGAGQGSTFTLHLPQD